MSNKRLFWLIGGLGLLLLLVWARPVAAQTTHVVKQGETLFLIALQYNLTWDRVAQANGIVNPNLVYAGQTLIIPTNNSPNAPPAPTSTPAPASAPTAVPTTAPNPEPPPDGSPGEAGTASFYTVQRGDTLYRIAVAHGLPMTVLAQANGITNLNLVYVGQRLIIPAGGTAVGPNPTLTAANYTPVGGAKRIDINLTTQTLTAYEGDTAVFSSLISSGRWPYLTVTGEFSIYLRHVAQDMNGYRLGFDYYLTGVPHVQYFHGNYAIHGTYWHSNFGTPMSHGCVNMNPADAEWLYNWSSHGTKVRVHY